MKANWDDAPLRVRRTKSHKPFVFVLVMVAGIAASALMAKNLNWQVDRLAKALPTVTIPEAIEAPAISSAEIKHPAEAAKDFYLDQVNRMLTSGTEWGLCEAFKDAEGGLAEGIRTQSCKPNSVAEMEWAQPRQPDSERQTVFTDSNYTKPASVNTIRMARPQPQPAQPQQRQTPYVTVVKETKSRCGFYKPGSTECRRYRAQAYRTYSQSCVQGRDSQSVACRLAKAYEPTR